MEQQEKTENVKSDKVKVTVVKVFRDKFDKSVLYNLGQEIELESERAKDVVERGLAEYQEPLG